MNGCKTYIPRNRAILSNPQTTITACLIKLIDFCRLQQFQYFRVEFVRNRTIQFHIQSVAYFLGNVNVLALISVYKFMGNLSVKSRIQNVHND